MRQGRDSDSDTFLRDASLGNSSKAKCVRDEIIAGIAQGDFHVVYQLRIFADGSRIAAVEALLRWKSALRGPVGPADFVIVAERVNVGTWRIRPEARVSRRLELAAVSRISQCLGSATSGSSFRRFCGDRPPGKIVPACMRLPLFARLSHIEAGFRARDQPHADGGTD